MRRVGPRSDHLSTGGPARSAEASQQPDDAPRPVAEQHGGIECPRGPFADLAKGRVGRDHRGYGADLELRRDGERPETDTLARPRAHDSGAENADELRRDRLEARTRAVSGKSV